MSATQLLLPESSTEERAVVDRFIEASRDIVPTLQVTLAKRFVRAGSNRVVCLAARTSVPLNDDEVASVSDLALRLSDGTNVALSLSFFNDSAGSEYVPVRRAASEPYRAAAYEAYLRPACEPYRHTVEGESRLGLVLLAMAVVGLAGFYALLASPLSRHLPLPPALKALAPSSSRSAQKPKVAKVHTVTRRSVAASGSQRSPRLAVKRPAQSPKDKRSIRRLKPPRARALIGNDIFVPPPPPNAFTLPAPPAFATEWLQGMSPKATPMKAAKRPQPPDTGTPRKADLKPTLTSAGSPPATPAPESRSELFPGTGLDAVLRSTPEHLPEMYRIEPSPEPIPTLSPSSGVTAPVPASEPASPQLERIVWPVQGISP